MVALTLRQLILFDRARLFQDILPLDDPLLRHELPRMFLRYLGVESDEILSQNVNSNSRYFSSDCDNG
jgi:hypothetical protein